MSRSEHKRIKVGHLPGDLPHSLTIGKLIDHGRVAVSSWGQVVDGVRIARYFRKKKRIKERAVLKERTRREIERQLGHR